MLRQFWKGKIMFNPITASMSPLNIFKTKRSPFLARQNMVIFCIPNFNFIPTNITFIWIAQFSEFGCRYFTFIFTAEIPSSSAKSGSFRGSVINFLTKLTPRMAIFSIRSHAEFVNISYLFAMRTFSFFHDLIMSRKGQKINQFRRFLNVQKIKK